MRQKPEEGIHDGVDGESETTLKIQFTNGNLLTGETTATTVSAKVLKGETDITSEYAASAFVWTRDTGNAAADATWNAAHNGVKQFAMNAADLTDDVKLTCTLTGTSPDYGTVYVDEDMNLIHAPAEADANDTLHLENGILSVEAPVNEYELNENVLSIVRNRLNGSVTAEAWVYTAAPEKLVEFKYDSHGLRTQKKVTDHGQVVTTDYIYHGRQLAGLTCGNDTLHFFYDAQGHSSKVEFNGTVYTYLHNLQGDIVGIVDNAGVLVVEYKYDAWGKPLSATGTLADTLGKRSPFRYRGYVFDDENGLYYLRSRYYNPVVERFVNADKILCLISKSKRHNTYVYCYDNPLCFHDKDGTSAVSTLMQQSQQIMNLDGPYPFADIALGVLFVGAYAYDSYVAWNKSRTAPNNSSASSSKEITSVAKTVAENLGSIAGEYGNLQCVDAKAAMLEYLLSQNLHGTVIELQFAIYPGYVYSNSREMVISENGFHVGVEYEGIVYCNVHPEGMAETLWINDFEDYAGICPPENITRIEF